MLPQLKERFLAPAGWATGYFVNAETGHKIHHAIALPQNGKPPSAIVVTLGGLSEFSEKYYEFAHDMLDRGYGFAFPDWQYQGRSGRHPKYPQRRHSDGFSTDVSDLHIFIADHIMPLSEKFNAPLVMVGHSMGGHIGLRFLARYPGIFKAAAFTAPFLGIHNFNKALQAVAAGVRIILPLIDDMYVGSGGDWNEAKRPADIIKFSSDRDRSSLHNIWSKTDPALQIGDMTYRWVIEALNSCLLLSDPAIAKSIGIPTLIGIAGHESVVDNNAIRAFASNLPDVKILELGAAYHEILMETDDIRNTFLSAFDKMLEENKIVATPSPQPA